MTELKTLKDMEKPMFKWNFVDRDKLCSRVELKQEATKHIKSLEKEIQEFQKGTKDFIDINRNNDMYGNKKKIDWIKEW